MIAPWYALMFAKIDRIAARHGYAVAVHGSMARDLDLIAIPWTEDADDPAKLLKSIDRFIIENSHVTRKGHKLGEFHPNKKPHGRIAYAIHIGWENNYIDLSIMPRIKRRK